MTGPSESALVERCGTALYRAATAVRAVLDALEANEPAMRRLIQLEANALSGLLVNGEALAVCLKTCALRLNGRAAGDARDEMEREKGEPK